MLYFMKIQGFSPEGSLLNSYCPIIIFALESILELKNVTVMKKALNVFRSKPTEVWSIFIWEESE